jgi:hypothetical protein
MSTGDLIATITAAAATAALLVAYATYRLMRNSNDEWAKTDDAFKRAREILKHDMARLQSMAQEYQSSLTLVDNVPLLVKPGWIPPKPLPFDAVVLDWEEPTVSEEELRASLEPARRATRMYWTRAKDYRDTYHQVISRLELPDRQLFFDGSSYRLLDVAIHDDSEISAKAPIVLTFTAGRYFDALDTTDVLGYETALLTIRSKRRGELRHAMRGKYRRWLGDPFDLRRRCAIPGICTLTVRLGSPVPSFILHERNPQKVALAQGVAHVTPAGEFQPRNLSNLAGIIDLDIWNNMTREYAEEFLGVEQAQGQPIDERSSNLLWSATSALDEAHQNGGIRTSFLGIGMDPLTWKPEILTVAVFEAEVFDTLFRDIVKENDEGKLIFNDDRSTAGISFTEDNVKHRIRGRMLTAGKACLYLAWEHRQTLGIRD